MIKTSKKTHLPSHDIFGDVRTVLLEHGEFRLHAWIIHGVNTEQISQTPKEIIPQERKAGSVSQDEHPEVLVHVDDVRPDLGAVRRNNPSSIGQNHLPTLHQGLEDTGHVSRSFVSLVHDKDISALDSFD